jgi:hypothetical protein
MKSIWTKTICTLIYTLSLQATPIFAVDKISNNQFRLHGLSSFKHDQQKILTQWVTNGVNATRATLGVYPQALELYLYPKKSNQPVPWAHTRRDAKESIHLYVDPRFPLNKFINDWTIYHEIAHLAIPYLGSKYSWFSEGFASFMQYQIMADIDILDGTLDSRYQQKIAPHLRWFNSNLPAAEIAKRRLEKRDYPAGYWGGAYFFVLADQQLKVKNGISLISLITAYQYCCRTHDNNIKDLVKSLDNLIEKPIFSALLEQYETAPAKTLYPEVFGQ